MYLVRTWPYVMNTNVPVSSYFTYFVHFKLTLSQGAQSCVHHVPLPNFSLTTSPMKYISMSDSDWVKVIR